MNQNIKLKHFILEAYDMDNDKHIKLTNDLIKSENSELISSDIKRYIARNFELNEIDGITSTYVINFDNNLIGLAFVNYHPKEEELPEEIEIGAGLLKQFRGKHLGSTLTKELCDKLLEIYPKFPVIVGRIEEDNIPSIKSALKAGFEHIKDDEYHYKRK